MPEFLTGTRPGELTTRPAQSSEFYYTKIGREFVANSWRIVTGRVVSILPIASGPAIARVEVSQWLKTEPRQGGPTAAAPVKIMTVTAPHGALEVSEELCLLFLARPDARDSTMPPVVAVSRGEEASLAERIAWVAEDLRIAEIPDVHARRAATRERLLRGFGSESAFIKKTSLADGHGVLSLQIPVFSRGDAAIVTRFVSASRDREFGLRLLDFAEKLKKLPQ